MAPEGASVVFADLDLAAAPRMNAHRTPPTRSRSHQRRERGPSANAEVGSLPSAEQAVAEGDVCEEVLDLGNLAIDECEQQCLGLGERLSILLEARRVD